MSDSYLFTTFSKARTVRRFPSPRQPPAVLIYNTHCAWQGSLATFAVEISSSMSIVLPCLRLDSVPSGLSKLILRFYLTSMSMQDLKVSSTGLPSFLFQVPCNIPISTLKKKKKKVKIRYFLLGSHVPSPT